MCFTFIKKQQQQKQIWNIETTKRQWLHCEVKQDWTKSTQRKWNKTYILCCDCKATVQSAVNPYVKNVENEIEKAWNVSYVNTIESHSLFHLITSFPLAGISFLLSLLPLNCSKNKIVNFDMFRLFVKETRQFLFVCFFAFVKMTLSLFDAIHLKWNLFFIFDFDLFINDFIVLSKFRIFSRRRTPRNSILDC